MKKTTPKLKKPPPDSLWEISAAKTALPVETGERDSEIELFLAAAESFLDGWNGFLGRCLVTQTWEQSFSGIVRYMRLPLDRVTSARVFYLDPDDNELEVASESFDLFEDTLGSLIVFRSGFVFPAFGDREFPVRVEMEAGFGTPENVPGPVRTAALAIVSACLDGSEADQWASLGPVGAAASIFRRAGL